MSLKLTFAAGQIIIISKLMGQCVSRTEAFVGCFLVCSDQYTIQHTRDQLKIRFRTVLAAIKADQHK